jgi:cysteine desulfurase
MYAVETIEKLGLKNIENYERKLSEKLFDYLSKNSKIELYVRKEHLSTVLPFNIKGKNPIEIAEKLNSDYGIGVRAGSFCVYQVVRKLLKITDEKDIIESVKCGESEKIPGLIRASISLCNSEKDIDRIIAAVKELSR